LQFDRGRALLEQVVRAPGAETDLRGRAQWMIGETFFMQEKFSEAIAAYRQVEAISGSDEWTAASLVQAGKSFEQLGRTREATMCYSTLVSRFGNSPHAGGARRRLAAMTSGDPSSPGMIRR
jgi:TolA-binding protein